jgi:hypothetical protein
MALVNIQETWSGDVYETHMVEGVLQEDASPARAWTVLMDSASDTSYDAATAASIPDIGDAHPDATDAVCASKSCRHIGPYLYEVTCNYEGLENPLTAPYERSTEAAETTEAIDKDVDGNAIRNPVGDPIVGLTKDFADIVMVITRNEGLDPTATEGAYTNTVNDAAWNGFDAGTCRMRSITHQRVIIPGSYYYRTTYRIQYRVDGWNVRTLCEGLRYFDAGGNIINATDYDGNPVTQPVKLAADGTLLGANPDVWLEFTIYPESNFTTLALL